MDYAHHSTRSQRELIKENPDYMQISVRFLQSRWLIAITLIIHLCFLLLAMVLFRRLAFFRDVAAANHE